MPTKQLIYPAYGYEGGPTSPGTLLIYNYLGSARAWGGQDDHTRVERALDDINEMYSEMAISGEFEVRDYFTGDFKVLDWANESASGVSSYVTQEYLTFAATMMNGLDDRVYFAGEHLSIFPAWILGAMTSVGLSM